MTEGTEVPLAFKPFIFSSFVSERSEALEGLTRRGRFEANLAEGTEAPRLLKLLSFAYFAERSEALVSNAPKGCWIAYLAELCEAPLILRFLRS